MFSCLKNKRNNEILKLLFQNGRYLSAHVRSYEDDNDAKIFLEKTDAIEKSFFKNGSLDSEDVKTLLEINKKIRVFYQENDPEMKLFKSGMTMKRPKSFDERYRPLSGWKEYFSGF